jgi:hypothetical protein
MPSRPHNDHPIVTVTDTIAPPDISMLRSEALESSNNTASARVRVSPPSSSLTREDAARKGIAGVARSRRGRASAINRRRSLWQNRSPDQVPWQRMR